LGMDFVADIGENGRALPDAHLSRKVRG